ncbi:hypothetical protein [Streptomyces sp. NPDC014744]
MVLENGRIIEQGTHDQLMRAGGAYVRLFAMQACGYRSGTPVTALDT